ncbi:hypothetical protein E5D57_001147 [Metarhizium anisopliae]|nr:hypothetical protein E5D57_001147 [Metarhizium anisopliae]
MATHPGGIIPIPLLPVGVFERIGAGAVSEDDSIRPFCFHSMRILYRTVNHGGRARYEVNTAS